MKTTDRILTSNLWQVVAAIGRKAKTRQAAIAYVTAETVKFGKGDTLIADASDAAIRSGQTSAKVLASAHKRGAEVYSFSGLHAKVLVLDDTAIVGSANLSVSSKENLEECAMLTTNGRLVGQARAFVQQLREQSCWLDDTALKRLGNIPVEKRPVMHGRRKHKLPVQDNRCWVVGLTPKEDDELGEDDLTTRDRAEGKAVRAKPRARASLGWMRMVGKSGFRTHGKVGDRVMTVFASNIKSPRLSVEAPVMILSRHDGQKSTFFYFDSREAEKLPSLTKTSFARLLKGAALSWEPTPKMVREISAAKMEHLERLWAE